MGKSIISSGTKGLYRSNSIQRRHALRGLVLGAAVAAAMGAAAHADTIYWDGTGTSWNVAASWTTNPDAATPDPAAIPGAGDDVVFSANGVASNQTVTLGAPQSAASMTFNNANTTSFVAGGSTRSLIVGAGGILVNSGTGTVTIGSTSSGQGIAVTAGASQQWTHNGSNNLTITNAFTADPSLTSPISLTLAGSGPIRFNNAINEGTSGGTLSLVINTTGTVFLDFTNASNYSGGTTILSGTLSLNRPERIGSGAVTLGRSV
jgi:autotransporter-associated beta strand protein